MTGEVQKQGKFHVTKEALRSAVSTAIPEASVSGNWRRNIGEIVCHLPFIYIRLGPETMDDVYDRNVGGGTSGSLVNDHFTIDIFHSNCNISGCERGHFAQDVGTRVKDYLLTHTIAQGYDVDEVTMRESEPDEGAHRISRVIIEGRLQVVRVD